MKVVAQFLLVLFIFFIAPYLNYSFPTIASSEYSSETEWVISQNDDKKNIKRIRADLKKLIETETDWTKGLFVSNDDVTGIKDRLYDIQKIAMTSNFRSFSDDIDNIKSFLDESMPKRSELKEKLEALVEKSYDLATSSKPDVTLMLHDLLEVYPSDWKKGLFLDDDEAKKVSEELKSISRAAIKTKQFGISEGIEKIVEELSKSMPNRDKIEKKIKDLYEESKAAG